MPNNYFQFKQFTIQQEGSAMKVGTDGVLLGAWCKAQKNETILDIGTGTGLIAIMLAQRTEGEAKIDAVEIDHESYLQASENIANCKWNASLKIFHQSFQEFTNVKNQVYDRLVCNPPYFMNGLEAKNNARTQARSANYLPFEDLLQGAKKLLKESGSLSVVLPVEEGNYFLRIAKLQGFYLKRKTNVLPNPGKATKRYLLEFVLKKCECELQELVVENGRRHVYSPEYIALTKEFYLKF